MPIDAARIHHDIASIARFTQTPGQGATRPIFSVEWRQAIDYVSTQAQAAGCKVRTDAAGNLHARPTAIGWEAPAWMSGSHLDTTPNSGDHDGVVGVVVALEALRAAREDLKMACPLELIVWTGSSDRSFGESMIGSRAFAAELDAANLGALKTPQGTSYLAAGAVHGVNPEKLATDRLGPTTAIGLIEVHVENTLPIWEQGVNVAVVAALAARREFRCEFSNPPDVKGPSVLPAMAEAMLAIEKIAHDLGRHYSIFVGQLLCEPNQVELATQMVNFGIELRTPQMQALVTGDQAIRRSMEKIAQSRKAQLALTVGFSQSSIELDSRVLAKMSKSADTLRILPLPQVYCPEPYDAIALAGKVPAGMLLVPSTAGVRGNPDEFVRLEDIATATAILLETVRDRRLD